ncbi:MAG TPA: helix-turn-helix domain-containing protein [Gaiella sp.]|jgi:AcrR family transcriptional regulator
MAAEQGLRERKKQRTREHIAATARRLFAEHGFERVTVAQIARAAEVAEKTVFNYFPTKEDLFYSRLESFEEELLGSIRERAPDKTVVDAFGRFLLTPRGVFASRVGDDRHAALEELRTITRVITESPALLAREQHVFERYTVSLASLLAEETGARAEDVEARVVANALIGVHRALIDEVRRRVLAGEDDLDRLARDLRAAARRALRRLESGLGSYGRRAL